jgi:glycosyltransferase involved in cell wall biosynthesis
LPAPNTYDRFFRSVSAALDRPALRRVAGLIDEVAPDVVHLNQQVLEDGLEIVKATRECAVPLVTTVHIAHSASRLGARLGWLRDRVAERVAGGGRHPMIVVSQAAQRDLQARLSSGERPGERIRLVYNGIEPMPPITQERREEIRGEWGAQQDVPVIGVVGRIEEQKNPVFFVRVMEELGRRGIGFHAAWVGDGRLREDLQAELRRAGLADRVHIDGWRDDVAERLRAMDVFILPSRFEGLPFALQEAMLAGLPVCVAAADGMTEVIEHGVSGFLCEGEALPAWSDCLAELLASPERSGAMGAAAAAFARQHFSAQRMAEETARIYREAIEAERTVD